MKVQVYGTGCAKCQALEKTAKKAIDELGENVEVEKIEEMEKILEAGLLSVPGFAVEEDMKSMGRVPSVEEITKWIKAKL
ncbi:Thioredoxin domain protein [anaerobic digester metagenome]|jgi:small redox-active disulfide protein 2|uniref:Thioredoxin n=1 Tax=Methanobacterium subterraneum TaxID=59277 RepID=A0A2H4VT07_9EURY|nr:MTH895/ArsE family thioredoxin-like protein [Methanobacterium subterraneum]AUB61202.1 redox-active disulfide protein 2 [Methanobacterium subterraneum]